MVPEALLETNWKRRNPRNALPFFLQDGDVQRKHCSPSVTKRDKFPKVWLKGAAKIPKSGKQNLGLLVPGTPPGKRSQRRRKGPKCTQFARAGWGSKRKGCMQESLLLLHPPSHVYECPWGRPALRVPNVFSGSVVAGVSHHEAMVPPHRKVRKQHESRRYSRRHPPT